MQKRTQVEFFEFFFSLRSCRSSSVNFFLLLGGKFSGKFGGNFAGFLLAHKIEAQNFRGKFLSIFREKFRASKKIFRANFVLQTCHPKFFSPSFREAAVVLLSAVKQRGRERKGAPRNHQEISSQKLADFECRFPDDSYGRDRAPFWPFLGEGFWRQYPGAPSPLFYCWR